MSYSNLKTVAGLTVAAEDEKKMQWLAVLEPDQRREGAATSTVEQQQRSAHWCSAVLMQCRATTTQYFQRASVETSSSKSYFPGADFLVQFRMFFCCN